MNKTEVNTGLLVMHYGTPATMDDVLPYYTHIRRGHPPSDEQLQDLVGRYEAIGGPSPLTHVSQCQAELIQQGLLELGVPANLYVGTKHAPPFIADAVRQMAEDGIKTAVGVVLAPHYSTYSVAAYKRYALDARDQNAPDMELEFVERWGMLPEFVEALTNRVLEQLDGWNASETLVIFSAHSLPEKIMATGDPYKEELMETSRLVAENLELPNWTFAFQSASDTGEPWLGPDILDVIEQKAASGKFKNVLACTVGFVSDHLEVLYDLGIETRDRCDELGLNFRRANTIGEDPKVMHSLAALCKEKLPALEGAESLVR